MLRRTTGSRDSDGGPSLAEIPPAATAVVALVALQRRVHRHLVTDGALGDVRADRHDITGELVAGHDGQGGCELSLEDVQVRAADAAPGHGDDDLARAGSGVRHGGHVHLTRSGDDCCLHLSAPREGPRTSLSWAAQPAATGAVVTRPPLGAGRRRGLRWDIGISLVFTRRRSGAPRWRDHV